MKINFMDQLDLAISISYLEKCCSGHVCLDIVAELTSELVVGGLDICAGVLAELTSELVEGGARLPPLKSGVFAAFLIAVKYLTETT